MRRLFHRNVVILFEVLEEHGDDSADDLDDEERVCMVQEYMEGGPTMTYDDERGVFRRGGKGISVGGVGDNDSGGSVGGVGDAYSEQEAKALFRDLAQGLLYLHDKGIIHRDIKVCYLLTIHNSTKETRRAEGDSC